MKKSLLAGLLILLFLSCGKGSEHNNIDPVEASSSPKKPHIVILTVDTLRQDALGLYGGSQGVLTPHMDDLLSGGVRFGEMRTPIPITLPSHLSIFTGNLVPEHGVFDNGLKVRLSDKMSTLPSILKSEGYETVAFISSLALHSRYWENPPFDYFDDRFGNQNERNGEDTLDSVEIFLSEWSENSQGAPLFLWVHLNEPHEPYLPPEPYLTQYGETYAGEVAFTDDLVGRFSELLKDNKLFPSQGNSILVFLSDHGESLGDHGESTHGTLIYDTTLLVPAVILGIGEQTGMIVEGPTATIDLMPTLLAYLDVETEEKMSGENLFSNGAWSGRKGPMFHESMSGYIHYGWAPLFARTEGDWKFIMAPTKELYDITSDPAELENRYLFEQANLDPLWDEQLKNYIVSAEKAVSQGPKGLKMDEGLMALGYVWAGGIREGDPKDPKDLIHLSDNIKGAVRARSRGDYAELFRLSEKVLAEDADNSSMHQFRAEALFALQETEKAHQESLILVTEFRNFRPGILTALKVVLNSSGSTEMAEKIVEGASKSFPNDAEVWYHIGQIYLKLQDPELAKYAFTRSKNIKPDARSVYYLLKIATQEDRLENGIVLLQEMAELGVPSPEIYKEPWIQDAYDQRPEYQELIKNLGTKKNAP